MKNQGGQIILILVLVMTVALAIGISVIQRSLSDISTASKVEQSSRAFSAAEAGIEKILAGSPDITAAFNLGNNASIENAQKTGLGGSAQAIEYPSFTKEEAAHIWLADPAGSPDPAEYYKQNNIDIYWGLQGTTDKPAIEVTVIYKTGSVYDSKKFFLDADPTTSGSKGFTNASVSGNGDCNNPLVDTNFGSNRKFLCKSQLSLTNPDSTSLGTLMLVRARFLYISNAQPFAVAPLGTCTDNTCKLPLQGSQITATGTSGQTQRKIQVFRIDKVVPFYFDYGLFSNSAIDK